MTICRSSNCYCAASTARAGSGSARSSTISNARRACCGCRGAPVLVLSQLERHHDHQRRSSDQHSRDSRAHRARGERLQGARRSRRRARRDDAAQRFRLLRSFIGRRDAWFAGGADQLAPEGRGGCLHSGRQRRSGAGLPRRPAAPDQGWLAEAAAAAGGDDSAGNRRCFQCFA